MEHIKTLLRNNPRIYNLLSRSKQGVLRPLRALACYFDLQKARLSKKPYLGNALGAKQGSFFRYPTMRRFIEGELLANPKSDFRILEVGSWAGGSAIVWAQACEKANKGSLICIDHWQATDDGPVHMRRATRFDRIFKLFLHNIRYSGAEQRIAIMKGTSDQMLAALAQKSFDFIYIDGDHRYKQFKKDLQNAIPLLKDGGVIGGDDLELTYSQIDSKIAEKNKDSDFIQDPKTGTFFHPGICLAVHEVFGEVSMKDGFWIVRKVANGWAPVKLN